ncbi:MAG: TM2 domain-containing protein [Bacteroidaceae bacterium]|nr:TM2 domain-containing protein [Bacteroidaceae bacterium]
MEQQKVDMFIATNVQNYPEEQLPFLREKLAATDDSKWPLISTLQPKNPTTMLIISIIVGSLGIDRFMLGETGLGILKLVTGGGCGIWSIVDWFLIQNKTKEFNYNKLVAYLG